MIPEGLPELTLGWEILDWCTYYLAQPDGKYKGQKWVFTNEQAKFVLWFYAIDETGAYIFEKAILERPKGWGKSPMLAAISCVEFMGPVMFAGWDAYGKPVGMPTPTPQVQIAAISNSQAENTYALCREMMLEGELINEYPDLSVMLSKSTYPTGRLLEKVTSSPRGREGNRATFAVMDETHLWVPQVQGPELFEAINRNLVKMDCRFVETTNAPVPGEESVAELESIAYTRMLEESKETGKFVPVLFDTRQVAPHNIYDREEAFPALEYVYGDATKANGGWLNLERVWSEINNPMTTEQVSRRFYFNQKVSPPSSWLDYADWMDCFDARLKLRTGEKVALGFKSAQKMGVAALVGCRLSDGALFRLGWWETPDDAREQGFNKITGKRESTINWEVPWSEVDARVRNVLDYYDVIKLIVDPVNRRDISSQWYADYPDLVEEFYFTNKGKFSKLCEQFETQVEAKRIKWNSHDVSRHVLNSHSEEVPGGKIIRQDTPFSTRYIGGAQAALLAVEAASLAIQDGALKEDNVLFSF